MIRLGVVGRSPYVMGCMNRWNWNQGLGDSGIQVTGWMSDHLDDDFIPDGIPRFSRTANADFLEATDAVWIASSPERHLADIELTSSAGKYVLCEKPIVEPGHSISGVTCFISSLSGICQEKIAVGYQLPFHIQFARLRQRICQIYPLSQIQIIDRRQINVAELFSRREVKPGIMTEVGCHYIHLVKRLLEVDFNEFKVLTVRLGQHQVEEIDDQAIVRLEVRGIEVSLFLTWSSDITHSTRPKGEREKSIHAIGDGTANMEMVDPAWPTKIEFRDGRSPDKYEEHSDPSLNQLRALRNMCLGKPNTTLLATLTEALEVSKLLETIRSFG